MIAGLKRNAGRKLELLKETPFLTGRIQASPTQDRRHIFGSPAVSGSTGSSPLHPLRSQFLHVGAQVADFPFDRRVPRSRAGGVFFFYLRQIRRQGFQAETEQGPSMIPVSQEYLGPLGGSPIARPGQCPSIRRKHGQTVKPLGKGHPDRFGSSRRVHQIELKIVETVPIGGKDEVASRRMKVGGPGEGAQMGQLLLLAAIHLHGKNLSPSAILREASPAQKRPVGTEKWSTVVTGSRGQAPQLGTIGFHPVNLHEVRRIVSHVSPLLGSGRLQIGVAVGGEDDRLTIGRPAGFRIITLGRGQSP